MPHWSESSTIRGLGNIRELEHAVESACALATGILIDVDDLPDEGRGSPVLAALSLRVRPLRDVEREDMLAALPRNGWKQDADGPSSCASPQPHLFRTLTTVRNRLISGSRRRARRSADSCVAHASRRDSSDVAAPYRAPACRSSAASGSSIPRVTPPQVSS